MKPNQCLASISDDDDANDKYFSVDGASKTLDGLDVKVSKVHTTVSEISVIRRSGTLMGDRPWQEVVAPGALFIANKFLFLSQFQDEMEFTSTNDFGKHLASSNQTRGATQLLYTEYENAISVEVKDVSVEPNKVLYARVFFGNENKVRCYEKLEDFVYNLKESPLAVIERLKEIK